MYKYNNHNICLLYYNFCVINIYKDFYIIIYTDYKDKWIILQ